LVFARPDAAYSSAAVLVAEKRAATGLAKIG